jgi:uncharacterized tellurite resistance protein B-like protein
MVGLLVIVLLATVGTSIAYRFSPAAKLKPRLREALSPFEELDADSRSLEESLKNETGSLTNQYVQRIYASRLQAIPVDELKKYASGMRLQALKDVGIRTVADLQGWNEYRVSEVRGVGPKSAGAIVRSVASVTAAAKAIAIPHPAPPFSDEPRRQLMQALYRQKWFGAHVSDQATEFATIVTTQQRTRDAILAKTTLATWLWKLGQNRTIRRSLEEAAALIETLADQGLQQKKESLSRSLAECRAICANRVLLESIIEDSTKDPAFYDAYLAAKFGTATNRTIEKAALKPEVGKMQPSDTVHAEFGRVIPGPPPPPPGAGANNSDGTTGKPQQSEILFSVLVGSTVGHAATDFALPSRPRMAEPSDLRWFKKGETVQIQGHNLSHGFIYVGKGVNNEQHYAINPRLSAKAGDLSSADATGYYSSYSLLSPDRRALYLEWLAAGALSPEDSNFGTLYLYGMERRLLDLLQNRITDPFREEQEQLLQEVHRLAGVFKDKPGSVTQCCSRLADFAAACTLDTNAVPELPREWVKTWELPFIVRYGVGWFMKNGRPIPMEWALRWVYTEPTIYLRTPATRCPEEFQKVFALVYRDKFGDGLIIPSNKTKLKLTYQPGWPMQFGQEIQREFNGVPDVAALSTPQQTLKTLVEQATAEIDGYSRYLGRNPAKSGTLEARLNLPLRLWSSASMEQWGQFLDSFVEPLEPMALETLLKQLDPSADQSVARLPEIVGHLSGALVGFEPDILAGARRPKISEMIVLFPLTAEGNVERTTPEYKRASLIISMSACVALADGHASEDEAAAVEGLIASWSHLHVDLRTRLRAQYRLQTRNEISLANLKSRFADLAPDGRLQMAQSLCALAAADGNIAAAEVKLLEQIYRALELDSKLLYSHLHLGRQHAHGLDSQALTDRSDKSAYAVDTDRLAALRQETDQVSALLAKVFAEESLPDSLLEEPASMDTLEGNSQGDVLLPGLDPVHQRFFGEVLRKSSWTREELRSVAAQLQIMLDGALERINDAAFDLFGEPVTEGDDPIYVQQNILEAAE